MKDILFDKAIAFKLADGMYLRKRDDKWQVTDGKFVCTESNGWQVGAEDAFELERAYEIAMECIESSRSAIETWETEAIREVKDNPWQGEEDV